MALAACSRGGDWRQPAQTAQAAQSNAGYIAPPRFTAADRRGDGAVEVVGRATPNVSVRMASPDGTAFTATTDSRGAFSLAVPAPTAVRLFGLSEAGAGRPIQGEGYVALLPTPGRPAALLRAGVGAQAAGAGPTGPAVTAIDFDASGDTVVSGFARPGQPIRLAVDGAAGGEVHADAQGRFSFTLAEPLKPGDHAVVVQSQAGQASARFTIGPAAPISGLPYSGRRVANGWRVDWLTPSGGEQTTLIMD